MLAFSIYVGVTTYVGVVCILQTENKKFGGFWAIYIKIEKRNKQTNQKMILQNKYGSPKQLYSFYVLTVKGWLKQIS